VAPARLGKEGTYDIVSNATQLKNDNKFFVYPNGYAQFMAVNGATETLGNKDNPTFYTVWLIFYTVNRQGIDYKC
jgi:hypothetical protein